MSELYRIMQEPLPTVSQQKRFVYRPALDEVQYLYSVINRDVFDNVLPVAEITVKGRWHGYWGMCYGEVHEDDWAKPYCTIRVTDKWWSKQWLIIILAHEMCHHYQWVNLAEDRLANKKTLLMSHGPSFFAFRDKLKEHGVPLKKQHSRSKWFATQNFFK